LSADPKIATRQIAERFPKGTSASRARQELIARGFQLSQLSTDAGPNHLLIASCVQGDRSWQVGLLIIDEKVVGSSVTIADTAAAGRK
jgi:hypothetical protein